MNTKHLPAIALALIGLSTLPWCGCATSGGSAATTCTTTNTCVEASTNTAITSTTTALPQSVTERGRLSIADFRKAKYPVDGRNFTPVDKNIAKLGVVKDDAEGTLNPY